MSAPWVVWIWTSTNLPPGRPPHWSVDRVSRTRALAEAFAKTVPGSNITWVLAAPCVPCNGMVFVARPTAKRLGLQASERVVFTG